MSVAIFCVFLASLLPVVFVAYAKFAGGFKTGKHNSHPREFLASLEGKYYRARCAHDNSWEAFAPFAAAVILAMVVGVTRATVDTIALAFVFLRILYGVFYIYDKHLARSTVFFLAWGCTVSLFMLAAFH